jgi:hypothetical protein
MEDEPVVFASLLGLDVGELLVTPPNTGKRSSFHYLTRFPNMLSSMTEQEFPRTVGDGRPFGLIQLPGSYILRFLVIDAARVSW